MSAPEKLNIQAAQIPVIVIVGPTASGKTALSLKLAEKLPVEIVACDSRTIYRRMDIGTAKPSAQEQLQVRHHLLDVADVDQVYTAANYKEEATKAIDDIRARGKYPIVCGGTGLYARALLEGFSIPAVAPNIELRNQLNALADEQGNDVLFEKLQSLDPVTAQKVNPNDRFRVVRAIEVSLALGKPFSEAATKIAPPYPTIWIGMGVKDRQYIKGLIEHRFDEQVNAGLMDEVRGLLADYGQTRALLNAVPYKEAIAYLAGEISIQQAREQSLIHNYQLARRQLMWFRTNEQINWFMVDTESRENIFSDVLNLISKFHQSI